MVKDLKIEDYDYPLPEEKIPKHPLQKRDECKLLLYSPQGKIYHKKFKELPDLLPLGSLLVRNDTKVINARLSFHKSTGAAIELFLLEPLSPTDYILNFQTRKECVWKCLVGNSKKWKEGEINTIVPVEKGIEIKLQARRKSTFEDGSSEIEFTWDNPDYTFSQIIERTGVIPIPPYLNRATEETDKEDYQTVYARENGSVAAPTAGLHFTPAVFENLEAHSIKIGEVTLHVGAGTFRPVKSESIGDHQMHSEPFTVSIGLLKNLLEWKLAGRPVIAVGTTTVRTLESLPYIGQAIISNKDNPFHVNQWDPYVDPITLPDTLESLKAIIREMEDKELKSITASTSIMIAPGFNWKITDGMVTNFHQPKSTLLLLVSSFLGEEKWREIYGEALKQDYRFLSYGDACLFLKQRN
ncbi:MAG: S-adenosylmethionine:tRNA ribosyltransferase-isomerase [Muribaculaceae bacterium]|nr:S-adenosylmethionine:tRNA ribosyltransferase-isomerase [Muribaculaceae bacterium]